MARIIIIIPDIATKEMLSLEPLSNGGVILKITNKVNKENPVFNYGNISGDIYADIMESLDKKKLPIIPIGELLNSINDK